MRLPARTDCWPGAAITATFSTARKSWLISSAVLKHRSQLLDPRRADPDMADELVRRDLGLVRPDEVVVPLN
jgi:hypothetical protein